MRTKYYYFNIKTKNKIIERTKNKFFCFIKILKKKMRIRKNNEKKDNYIEEKNIVNIRVKNNEEVKTDISPNL